MKVLILGSGGMLGTDVARVFAERGHQVLAPRSGELDVTDPEAVARVSEMKGVEWCINCVAYTAVDKAEEEVREATELNTLAPGYIARACAMGGIKLLHVSTDFVFDGQAHEPYAEDAPTNPQSAYGRSKRDGEEAVLAALPNALIFRTAWLFGPNGKSFPKTMINAWQAEKPLRVVSDQTGSPTYTGDLAKTIADSVEADLFPGIYHAAGPEAMTWHALAVLAVETFRRVREIDRDVQIGQIRTEDWPTPAVRPVYSVLSGRKLSEAGIAPMRSMTEAMTEFVQRLAG